MKTTSFYQGLKIEDKNKCRQIFKSIYPERNIQFENYPGLKYDDIILSNNERYNIEYKQDYWCHKTNNIALEIIPYIPCELKSKDIYISGLNGQFKTGKVDIIPRRNIMKGIKDGGIKLSRHFVKENYMFLYINFDINKNIHSYLLFNGNKLSEYFVREYVNQVFVLTTTERDKQTWATISALFNIHEIKQICQKHSVGYNYNSLNY